MNEQQVESRRKAFRNWYAKNKHVLQQKYVENRSEILQKQKQYYDENSVKILERRRLARLRKL